MPEIRLIAMSATNDPHIYGLHRTKTDSHRTSIYLYRLRCHLIMTSGVSRVATDRMVQDSCQKRVPIARNYSYANTRGFVDGHQCCRWPRQTLLSATALWCLLSLTPNKYSDSLTRVRLRLRENTFLPQRSGAESENGPSPEKKNGANERGIDGKRSKESLLIVYVES